MKEILYLTLLALLSVSFSACSDDDEKNLPDERNTFSVSVFYRLEGSTSDLPDENSVVYIFEGDYSDNSLYEYKGNGQFVNKSNSNWRNAKANYKISKFGSVDIEVNYDCTIVAESKYYEGKHQLQTKPLSNKDKSIKFVFSAE